MDTVVQSTVGEMIADRGRRRTYAPGCLIFVEGDHSHSVYVCLEGRVRIYLTTPSGRELLVGIKLPGDEFGELSAIDGRPRSATAAAIDQTLVGVMPASDLMVMLRDDPELSVGVCQSLSAELRRSNDRLVTLNSKSATVRTGRMLVELASLIMRHSGTADSYEVPITQADLAGWIGATRESTARALGRFRRAGLIETCRGRIVVLDVVALSHFVGAAVQH